jgi:hypothetical protein
MDLRHLRAVKNPHRLFASVESNHGHTYRCAVQDPWAIAPGQEDIASPLDPLEHSSICPATD